MQRSKQQALFFVLGAVLVGGALGFSAKTVMDGKHRGPSAPRQRMYNDLEMSEAQRQTYDSILDERNCQIGVVMRPVQPRLDSIRSTTRKQLDAVLNQAQLTKLEGIRSEMSRRDSLEKVRRDSIAATKKTTITCRN